PPAPSHRRREVALDKTTILVGILLAAMNSIGSAQETNKTEVATVTESSKYAFTVLLQPRCAGVFGEGAAEALQKAEFRFVPMGKPRLHADGRVVVVTAATLKEFNLILINRDGPFLQTAMTGNRIGGLGVDFRFGLSPVAYRALILLHELGHLMGKF